MSTLDFRQSFAKHWSIAEVMLEGTSSGEMKDT